MSPSGSEKAVSESITPVIEAVAERIHYAEGRRVNYTVMAVALIAGGISVLVFALGSIGEMWLKYAALTASFGFVLVGLLVIFTYGRQTNQYPYTSATRTWKWFYRDALPDRKAFSLRWLESRKTRTERITAAYRDQLPLFKAEVAKLDSEQVNAGQDVEQLYSLHVNELYKNIYLSRLRSLFNWGLLIAIGAAAVAGVWGEYLEIQARSLETATVRGPGWTQQVDVRLLSEPLADFTDVVVHITISNTSAKPISIAQVVVRDRNGWPLPVEVKFQRAFPATIAPNKSADAYVSIHTARAVWGEKASLGAEIK